jgi:hypothetical protein
MTSRSELDALLRQLELDVPYMKADMNGFYREFEDRSEMILGVADDSEQEYVLDCLMTMLRRAGVSGKDGYKGPTLH